MTTYAPFDRDQAFLLPPELKDWLPEDDIAHFIVAAVQRVRLGAFRTNPQAGEVTIGTITFHRSPLPLYQ